MKHIYRYNIFYLLLLCPALIFGQNAPITTGGSVSSSGTSAIVPITVSNFLLMNSCALEIHYNQAIATATAVTKGQGVGGGMNYNVSLPGVIIIGWYVFPSQTLANNSTLFNINFTKVTSGTTALNFYDDGYSCYYADSIHGILNDLPFSSYYHPGTLTFGIPPVAEFTANNLTPLKNTTVQFTDQSTGSPTSWQWTFDRPTVTFVNGTSSTSQNPQVQFTSGGLYTVTLVATNAAGSGTKVKTNYLRAGTPGLWAGSNSTSWSTATNWDNWLVPVSSSDVEVPGSATFWPVYTGNMTLGTTCRSLTLTGSSDLTITGNLEIPLGYGFQVTANATVHIGGSWTNGGSFSAGSGIVEFYGSAPSTIFGAGSPPVITNFNNLVVSKSGTALTILPDIVVNGNVQINP